MIGRRALPEGESLLRDFSFKGMLLYVFLVSIGLSVGARAADVVWDGAQPPNKKLIERLVKRDSIPADSVASLLSNEGYFDATVSADSSGFHIYAGEISILTAVIWQGDRPEVSYMELPFKQREIEQLLQDRLRTYREKGYFYTTANIESVKRDGNQISIEVRISAGPLLTLERNVFTGLSRTKPELIERYLTFEYGQPLSEDYLSRVERQADDIPFLNFRPPLSVRPRPGYTSADIEYVFEEKKQVLFSGGGGFTPGSSSNVVWNLDLRFQNLLGGGRLVHLKSERREENRQILDIGYRQPVFIVGVGEAGLNIATRDYRDRFYEFSVKGDYQTRLSGSFKTTFQFGWRSVEPSGDNPPYSSLSTGLTIERSGLNSRFNPSSGLELAWTISFGYRRYADDSLAATPERNSFNETRTEVQAGWYRSLVGNLVGHIGLNYHALQTSESLPPLSELFYIGGPGTVRGFRNEQFTALRTAFGTVEPRLRFESGYLFAFYDAAYINNRVRNADLSVSADETYKYGYGIGAAIVDRSRSVKISIGWNPDTPFDMPQLSLEFSSEI